VKNAYDEAVVFSMMSPDEWKTRFKSYQYDWILSSRTPNGRLARRMSLVGGETHPGLALTDPADWKIGQKEATDYFKSTFEGSSRLLVIVGDAKELTPIVEKAFPSYKILPVPYRDLTQSATFKKLAEQLN